MAAPRSPDNDRARQRRRDDHRRFAELPLTERRAIMRAVNRGKVVEQRRHARLAVAVAQRQQRFWRIVWLLGPLVGLVQLPFAELPVVIGNAAASTVAMGLMSLFFFRRANRAERLNLEVAEHHRSTRSSHVPERGRRKRGDDAGPHSAALPSAPPRPPRPRGRKRQ